MFGFKALLQGKPDRLRVLMVCMGNICRSPMAEAAARTAFAKAGLSERVEIDSAGTHAFHAGEAADVRARQVAAKRGYDLSRCRARKISAEDFSRFDHILAMDRANLEALERLCPEQYRSKLKLFATYADNIPTDEIPDPYYGSIEGFEHVLDACEAASQGLVAACRASADNAL